MNAEKIVSVQICTYNRKDLLRKMLKSLFGQTLPLEQFEVILVDDCSTDGTREMVEEIRSHELPPHLLLRYIRQEKDGLSAARNKGVKAATGDYMLFIDDDVLASPRLLEEHVAFHRLHPGSVVNGWVNHVSEPEIPERPRFTLQDISTAFFWTSNVSVKREYLLKAGLFDEDFKEYGWEDLEMGLRLRKMGLKARCNPRAVGFHYKKKLTAADLPSMLRQAEAKGRTAVIFFAKHPSWRTGLATGIHPPRLFVDEVMARMEKWTGICEKAMRKSNGQLKGFSLWCAHQKIKRHYFQAVKEGLRKQEYTLDDSSGLQEKGKSS